MHTSLLLFVATALPLCEALRLMPPQNSLRVKSPIMQGGAATVTVIGGSGFVGSRVCERLVAAGCAVTSVSKSGKVPEWCAGEAWSQSVSWRSNNLVRGPREDLEKAIGKPDAIVSCVGSIGFDTQGLLLGNGKANEEVAKAAKKAGVKRFVYVSVSEEVAEAASDILPGYFTGKSIAEQVLTSLRAMVPPCARSPAHTTTPTPPWSVILQLHPYSHNLRITSWSTRITSCPQAILDAVGPSGAYFIKPSFIYGGDGFGVFPPRVSTQYGAGVEGLLSNNAIQKVADVLPGFAGLLKVALRPPVSVHAVAACCVRAALGLIEPGTFEGTANINLAADLPQPEAKLEEGANVG